MQVRHILRLGLVLFSRLFSGCFNWVFLRPEKELRSYQIQVLKLLDNAGKITKLATYRVASADDLVGNKGRFELLIHLIVVICLPPFQLDI